MIFLIRGTQYNDIYIYIIESIMFLDIIIMIVNLASLDTYQVILLLLQ